MAEEPAPVKLEFQNFGSSGEGAIDGRIGRGPAAPAPTFNPPPSDNIFNDKQSLLGSGAAASQPRSWNPFSVALFQSYFDVDTSDVLLRLKKSVSLSNDLFFADDIPKADMYGPFWLCTTLIFVMAVAGNMGAMMSFVATEDQQIFTYNFSKLTVATSLLYGYTGLVPLIGWAVSKWMFASPFGLVDLICIYGYALTVYIPAAILCIIPVEILRWVIIAAAFVVSVKFITRNVKHVVMRELDDKKAVVALTGVAALHGALALVLKVYFYS